MTYIETSGEVKMVFNQEMIYPQKIDQEFYNNILQMTFVSSVDSSLSWVGVFSNKTRENKTRALSEDNLAENFKFDLRVTKHNSKEINIKIDFDNPDAISRNVELDNMHIKILQP